MKIVRFQPASQIVPLSDVLAIDRQAHLLEKSNVAGSLKVLQRVACHGFWLGKKRERKDKLW